MFLVPAWLLGCSTECFPNSGQMICAKSTPSCPYSLAWGLAAPPFLLIGVGSLLKWLQSRVLWVLFSLPCFLHSTQCFSIHPTFLNSLGMRELIDSILCFPSAPFALIALEGFWSSSALFPMFLRMSSRAILLTGVVFSIKLYWVCHFAGHMCNRWVTRLESSRGNIFFVAWLVFGL